MSIKVNSDQGFGVLLTGFKNQKQVDEWISAYINSGEQFMGDCSDHLDEPFPSFSAKWNLPAQPIQREGGGELIVKELVLE